MFNTLRRWLASSEGDADGAAIVAWAQGRGLMVHRDTAPGQLSLVGQIGQRWWRLEYGAPRRFYITGRELRMSMDLGLPPALRLLLMSRSLQDRLETAGLEPPAGAVPAHVEASSTEEVRYAATYPKVALVGNPLLRPYFGMVASDPGAAQAWLHGRLGERAALFASQVLQGAPFLLMMQRGRLHLHLQAPRLPVDLLEQVIDLYCVAAGHAEQVLADWTEEGEGAWASTMSAAWQADESGVDLLIDKPPSR